MTVVTGGCQCGRVRYSVELADDDAYLCHCRMCQRATGGVSIAFKFVPRAAVTWLTREPDRYASSPIATRGFCRECGTPLTYEGEGSDHLDLTVGSFDDTARFRPVENVGVESWHAGWLDVTGLPTQRTDQNVTITARWMATLGKLPD
ncbi:MAG: GFA family protein [Sphingomonadaceae bacterium]|nr:GFA family protein [Sphingomonadaceae bacterium]